MVKLQKLAASAGKKQLMHWSSIFPFAVDTSIKEGKYSASDTEYIFKI